MVKPPVSLFHKMYRIYSVLSRYIFKQTENICTGIMVINVSFLISWTIAFLFIIKTGMGKIDFWHRPSSYLSAERQACPVYPIISISVPAIKGMPKTMIGEVAL